MEIERREVFIDKEVKIKIIQKNTKRGIKVNYKSISVLISYSSLNNTHTYMHICTHTYIIIQISYLIKLD